MRHVTNPTKVTVEAPIDRPDVLNLKDAMQQVMDFIDLLANQDDRDVVWRLVSAKADSPLSVECEGVV